MFRQFVLYWVTLMLAVAGSSIAQSSDQPRANSMPTFIAPLQEPFSKLSEIEFSVFEAAALPTNATGPTPALLREIVTWLAANFSLPAIYEFPHIELVPATELAGKRLKRIPPRLAQENGFLNLAVQSAPQREVVAVYNDTTKTIFLANSWRGKTPAEISIVVHEMVHHLQTLGNLRYGCPGAREKPAYMAQDQWLNMFGKTLEKEFQVDLLTLLVMSACML